MVKKGKNTPKPKRFKRTPAEETAIEKLPTRSRPGAGQADLIALRKVLDNEDGLTVDGQAVIFPKPQSVKRKFKKSGRRYRGVPRD